MDLGSALGFLLSGIRESFAPCVPGSLWGFAGPHWDSVLPFFVFFVLVYVAAAFLNGIVFGIKKKSVPLLSTCCNSFIHGLCCILAGCSILSQWDDRKLDHVNSELQNQVVQFSFAYLASDTLNAIFFDWDVLFLAHHVLSLLYLYAVLQLQVGAVSAVFVFFLGEVTSPIFNSFTVLRELKKDYKWASPWFHLVSPIFTVSFVLVRSVISVPLIYWYMKQMLVDSHAIPFPWRLFMVSLVGLGLKIHGGTRKARTRLARHLVRGHESSACGPQEVQQARAWCPLHAHNAILAPKSVGRAATIVSSMLVLLLLQPSEALALPDIVPLVESTVSSAGVLGPVVFIIIYAVAAVLFVPASVLTVSAGFLFGPWLGSSIVSIAATTGAGLAFLIGRYFARSYVESTIQKNEKFVAIDKAIASQGAKVVFLMRLSPLFPYSVINYSLGLTKVPFTQYIVASWIGMLPGTFAYVILGSAGKAAVTAGGTSSAFPGALLYFVGALATLGVTVLISREASKVLNEMDS
ncbi:hypothetical protein M9435_002388 [Picochlorum sp. BPE23]|nr:hypothetical protein M9435_002388 [Picochlorum sp. BPE23]